MEKHTEEQTSCVNYHKGQIMTRANSVFQQPTLPNLVKITIWTTLLLCCVYSTNAGINPQTTLDCLLREYTFRVSKSIRLKGKVLPCWDDVTVYSCWGRCDSYELGDYKIPYKISYHPVCTYAEKKSRLVRLRRCHPQHPDPMYEVFDATACSCSKCDSENTSCENLNG